MTIENIEVFGFKAAMHGMRNPMNSWDKSDSIFNNAYDDFTIGEEDNKLAIKLIKAGHDHRKFLRLIHIQFFISIPRYIWQELDTYKVATVRLSCSTMHKLGSVPLDENDFQDKFVLLDTLAELNRLGELYRIHKSVQILRQMKQILPEGFLQAADYDFNYETAIAMYHSRKEHRMSEWSKDGICKVIETLPMMDKWLNI